MAVMNRLSPLIVRRVGPMAAAAPLPSRAYDWEEDEEAQSALLEDLKLFATGWVGGLIFFGTLFS